MRDKDEKAIRQVLASYIRAFIDADAELMQSLFWVDDPAFIVIENHIEEPFGRQKLLSIMEWIRENKQPGGKMRFFPFSTRLRTPSTARPQ